jgi:hypothetical protein
MKHKARLLESTLAALKQVMVALFATSMLLAIPVAGNAQETTASIRGKVVDTTGNTVAGASVVVLDMRSGVDRSYATNSSGLFLATRLLPGGPYRITINGSDFVDVASIGVGDIYNLTVSVGEEAAIEEIIAVGQATELVQVAAGPSATFSIADIENSVGFSRDIADVYGVDPRLMIDVDEDGIGINCGGKHPRFNATTLDGVSMGDRFGLNENGYSTAVGMPFPYDGIEQIAVELAPFDVTYGGFSACIINSVTKSGTNEWQGKAFYEYSDNSFRGDTIKGDDADYSRESYEKTYLGFNVGGPLIKDRLFIFAAYEETDEPRFLAKGYDGSGNGEQRDWLSEADFERILAIASDPSIYGYDPGGQPGDGAQESEKYMVRLDWNINDMHNAALIYNYFDGFQLRDSDGDDNEFEFANHYYTKGAEAETFTVKLSSQWTDAFSTELFYSNSTMDDSQVTVGDGGFADSQISIGGRTGTVYLGADDSRQANSLNTEVEYIKLAANYLAGDHVITAGYDREVLDIFNIFVQHSRGGEYDYFDDSANNDAACALLSAQERFDEVNGCSPSGIDRFELGRPSRIYYGSAGGTNDPNDAAAVFANTLNTVYLQDEIFVDHLNLTLVAGLRYEWWESSDRPTFNQAFTDVTNGLRNDANLDGIDLLMPRVGFTWGVRDDLTLRGGVGLYSGGNPNVWLSNAWSNDGVSNVQLNGWDDDEFGPTFTVLPGMADSLELSGDGRPNYDVPQSMVDFVAARTADDANASSLALIDPNYKQPSEWKFAVGGTWDVPWGDFVLDFDYLHTRGHNPAYYKDVSQSIDTGAGLNGYTAAGSPIYDYFGDGEDNLMLTNSSQSPVSNMVSFVLRKEFDFGLDATLGYAWTEGEEVAAMLASTAGSNFSGTALLDINDPIAGKSNWVVPQRLTLSLFYKHAFFGDNLTRISLQGYSNEGQPQSYVMESDNLEGDGFTDRHLLYVPTGPSDPNVVFNGVTSSSGAFTPFDQDAFFQFIAREGLAPGFSERNEVNTSWTTVWNMAIRQDISLGDFVQSTLYLKIKNLGNLLNDDWGRVTDAQYFPQRVLDDVEIDDQGRFVYNSFSDVSNERTYVNPSLWEVRFGIDIGFGN